MFGTEARLASPLPSRLPGSIRNAEIRDLADLSRLLATRDVDPRAIVTAPRLPLPRYHLLVLDVDGAVRAAVHVVISMEPELRGRLQLLVVDPGLTRTFGRAVEDRLAGVAVALCEAYGCAEIDIAATPQDHVAAVRQVRAAYAG
jgi:hypothetical protein